MPVPIPATLPTIGPGSLEILRINAFHTNRDVLRRAKDIEFLPNFGPERAAILRDWAFRAEGHFTRLHKAGALSDGDLQLLVRDQEVAVRLALAEQSRSRALELLAADRDVSVRRAVAGNVATPPETLAKLVTDLDVTLRVAVAKNASTAIDSLQVLASDAHHTVRKAVVSNSSTPAETLSKLAGDTDASVVKAVAAHRGTPPEVLRMLATSDAASLRRRLAENPSTPSDVLDALTRDSERSVRIAVVKNPSLSSDALTALSLDSEESVRALAAQHPAFRRPTLGLRVGGNSTPSAVGSAISRFFAASATDPRDPWIARWWRSRAGQVGIGIYLIDCLLALSPEGGPLDSIRKIEVVTQLWLWTFFPGTVFLLYFLFKCLLGPCPSCGRRLTVSVGGTREIVERSGQELLHGRVTKSGRYDRRYNTQVRQWQQGRKETDYTCTCGGQWIETSQFQR